MFYSWFITVHHGFKYTMVFLKKTSGFYHTHVYSVQTGAV